jgi:hypothetical protein
MEGFWRALEYTPQWPSLTVVVEGPQKCDEMNFTGETEDDTPTLTSRRGSDVAVC